jgi:hypothetical protein
MSLYMMSGYGEGPEEDWLRKAWAKTGKKLDMGKCCIRFRTLDDLPLEVIGEAIRRVPAKAYVKYYQSAILTMNTRAATKAARSAGPSKPAKSGTPAQRAASAKAGGKKKAPKAAPARSSRT